MLFEISFSYSVNSFTTATVFSLFAGSTLAGIIAVDVLSIHWEFPLSADK